MNLRKIGWCIRALIYKASFSKIGNMCYIGKPNFISNGKNVIIGDKVRIYPGMRAEIVNAKSKLVIGDNVSIGQNFHVVSYNDTLKIGNHVTISGNVLITNVDHDYRTIGKHILEQKLLWRKTIIGDNCFIGYGAVIQAGTVLGDQCIVGANAVVRGNFPDYSVIVGSPGKVVKKYNKFTEGWEKV